MGKKVELVKLRLKQGCATEEDLSFIQALASEGDAGSLAKVVTAYMESAPREHICETAKTLLSNKSSYILGKTITGLGNRNITTDYIKRITQSYAMGAEQDVDGTIRVAAIFALQGLEFSLDAAKPILRQAFEEPDENIKEVTLVSYQRLIGIPEPEIIWDFAKASATGLVRRFNESIIRGCGIVE